MTGSTDKTIKVLNEKTFSVIQIIDCEGLFRDSIRPSIRALDVLGNKILVGTLGSEIYEIKANAEI